MHNTFYCYCFFHKVTHFKSAIKQCTRQTFKRTIFLNIGSIFVILNTVNSLYLQLWDCQRWSGRHGQLCGSVGHSFHLSRLPLMGNEDRQTKQSNTLHQGPTHRQTKNNDHYLVYIRSTAKQVISTCPGR